jgi:ADP-ribose pyrophosphatase
VSWQIDDIHTLFSHRLFALERQRLSRGAERRESLVLRAPDWVNVIAQPDPDHLLLVRQWRFGIAAPTLEIPGGMVDPGETPEAAAARELLEETGYRAARWRRLGVVQPNPAFLTNRTETWWAGELEQVGPPSGDGEEEITVELAAVRELRRLVASGEIQHSLVIAAFYLFADG